MTSISPRRIAIDARSYASSSGAYVRNLIDQLQRIDSDTLYDIYVPTQVAEKLAFTAPNFRICRSDASAYSPAEQLSFARVLLSQRYDLVHFAMQQQPVLYLRPHVTTFHDLTIIHHDTLNKGRVFNRLFRTVAAVLFSITLRTSRVVIVPSVATKRAVMSFARVPARKIVVTLEAADVTGGALAPYELPFSRYLLYVGNFYAYKNVERLVETHQRLLQTDPDLGLVLVGRLHRAAEPLVARIERSAYQNVVLTGFIDEDQRNWLYANCLAYVFPSLSEGFGLPALEAMSFGAPLVAARATSLPEVCRDGAEYFDPKDVGDMVAKVGAVAASEGLREQLRQRGSAVLSGYSWRRMAEETLTAYDLALSRSGKK